MLVYTTQGTFFYLTLLVREHPLSRGGHTLVWIQRKTFLLIVHMGTALILQAVMRKGLPLQSSLPQTTTTNERRESISVVFLHHVAMMNFRHQNVNAN